MEPSLKLLLQRAWLLGPHYAGPNLLLASQQGRGRGLFHVPDSLLVTLAKRSGEGCRAVALLSARCLCRCPVGLSSRISAHCALFFLSAGVLEATARLHEGEEPLPDTSHQVAFLVCIVSHTSRASRDMQLSSPNPKP